MPQNIFMLGNTPHDWLFPQVRAVIHHGGAGTTAVGLRYGKPTMVVPFFGDQPFWGATVAKAGAGPEPVPFKHLSAEKLAAHIKRLLEPELQEAANKLSAAIREEGDGAENAIRSFHASLNLSGNHSMRCSILPNHTAVWWLRSTHFRLSALAAEILVSQRLLQWQELQLLRHCEWNDFAGPGEPVTGVGTALGRSIGTAVGGIGRLPHRWTRTIRSKKALAEEETPSTDHPSSAPSEPSHGVGRDLAHDTKHGFVTSGRALAQAPVDLAMALAQGFHNAPRLYGDDTVRPPPRVDGVRSGLRTACIQFGRNVFDAWTGLVQQPRREALVAGADTEGNGNKAVRVVRGTGLGAAKGLGGFVIKDIAAVVALPAYALHGVRRHLVRRNAATRRIRQSHVFQGRLDAQQLDDQERSKVLAQVKEGWRVIADLRNEIQIAQGKGRVKGRLVLSRGKKAFRKAGAFESTEKAGRALQAARERKDIGDELDSDS